MEYDQYTNKPERTCSSCGKVKRSTNWFAKCLLPILFSNLLKAFKIQVVFVLNSNLQRLKKSCLQSSSTINQLFINLQKASLQIAICIDGFLQIISYKVSPLFIYFKAWVFVREREWEARERLERVCVFLKYNVSKYIKNEEVKKVIHKEASC